MSRSKRLKTVVDVAQMQSDKAGQQLQQSRSQHDAQQQQLEQLLTFQQEYKQRLESLGEAGMDARQLQDYRTFLQQLGKAVEQQVSIVAQSTQQLDQQQQAWVASHHRKNMLGDVLKESLRQESHEQHKREQREADERINSTNAHSIW